MTLLNKKITKKQQNFKNKKENIYEVKWGRKWSYLNECYINRIVIEDLKLEYYPLFDLDAKFDEYSSVIPFLKYDKVYTKNIEINTQLQQLLYSKDKLNRSLGLQIIFQKLGISYE